MDKIPQKFDHTVPVPGLVSLAKPPFAEPGPVVADRNSLAQQDPRRDAFWYRRSFNLPGSVPPVATLKVGKAMFGTRVILNGQLIGDHLPSFTPGLFDLRAALRPGKNELLIRVGAARDSLPPSIPNGFDYEKTRYIPGIFDSVDLILSGTPDIVNLQVAPDLPNQSARVQTLLHNAGEQAVATVVFTVREAKSLKLITTLTNAQILLAKGADQTVSVLIPMPGFRPWSPEDPFLYQIEADTGQDRFETRFGMRSFQFDTKTRIALLNGKPYFMRGSNITLYRFFEDPECGALPWDKNWVRLLHRRVKDMHWNCLRYCIGFPPEAWYRIADEEGILVQDEFPIWYGGAGWSKWPANSKVMNSSPNMQNGCANAGIIPLWLFGMPATRLPPPKPVSLSKKCAAWICRTGPGTTAMECRAFLEMFSNLIPTTFMTPNISWLTWPRKMVFPKAMPCPIRAIHLPLSMNTVGCGSTATARPRP